MKNITVSIIDIGDRSSTSENQPLVDLLKPVPRNKKLNAFSL
jgi:hypothetical protein